MESEDSQPQVDPSTFQQCGIEAQQQPQQQQQQQQPEQEADSAAGAAAAAAEEGSSSRKPGWRQRLIRYGIAAIQAVLLLEAAAVVIPPLLPRHSKSDKASADNSSDDGLDPADVLMDYFTGRRGLTALQLLSNKQLRLAVDSLVTEDFEELGVKDRGAEIREIVEGVIRVREEGPRPPPQPERVGLGKLGPLKFKNKPPARKAAAATAAAETAEGREQ